VSETSCSGGSVDTSTELTPMALPGPPDFVCLATTPLLGLVPAHPRTEAARPHATAYPSVDSSQQGQYELTCAGLSVKSTLVSSAGSCTASTTDELECSSVSDDFESTETIVRRNTRDFEDSDFEYGSVAATQGARTVRCNSSDFEDSDFEDLDAVARPTPNAPQSPHEPSTCLPAVCFLEEFDQTILSPSPSMVVCNGLMVKNTFVHMVPAPQALGARRRRARSVPKDIGSSKDAWESLRHVMLFRPKPLVQRAQCSEDVREESDSLSSSAASSSKRQQRSWADEDSSDEDVSQWDWHGAEEQMECVEKELGAQRDGEWSRSPQRWRQPEWQSSWRNDGYSHRARWNEAGNSSSWWRGNHSNPGSQSWTQSAHAGNRASRRTGKWTLMQ